MLPERLSNGVCSLKPEVDRLTHSVFIQFNRKGRAEEQLVSREPSSAARAVSPTERRSPFSRLRLTTS